MDQLTGVCDVRTGDFRCRAFSRYGAEYSQNFGVIFPGDLELYQLDPLLCGYRVVAAAQCIYPMRPTYVGDPTPPDDPVSTYLYGVAGGEGLQIEWKDELFKADGRVPARALAAAGYRVW